MPKFNLDSFKSWDIPSAWLTVAKEVSELKYLAPVFFQKMDSSIHCITIRETNYAQVQWIDIYPVDSTIHLSGTTGAWFEAGNSYNNIQMV